MCTVKYAFREYLHHGDNAKNKVVHVCLSLIFEETYIGDACNYGCHQTTFKHETLK